MAVEQADQQATETVQQTPPGKVFSTARESQGWSVQHVADKLNLPVNRITEIEEAQFDESINSTFYRGYIRSYAMLMNLNEQEVLAIYNGTLNNNFEIRSLSGSSSFTPNKRELSTNSWVFKGLFVVLLVVIMAGLYWGFQERFVKSDSESGSAQAEQGNIDLGQVGTAQPASSQSNQLSGVSIEGESESAEQSSFEISQVDSEQSLQYSDTSDTDTSDTDTSDTNASDSNASQPLKNDASEQSSQASSEMNSIGAQTSSEEVADGQFETIIFNFSGDCWVDIRDSRNERIAFGLKKSGRVMTLEGVAPFEVVLGDPSVVSVEFRGQPVELSQYRPGRTANLTIN